MKSKQVQEFKETEIGKIPADWEILTVGDVSDSISVKHSFAKDTIIFLNTGDIKSGKILHHNYTSIEKLPGQAKKSIKKNDILFSEIRPKNQRYAFVDFNGDNYVVSTKLLVIRSKKQIYPQFLYLLLTNPNTIEHLQILAETRSGTFPQITFDELKLLKIPVPTIEEQIRIFNFTSQISNKIINLQNQNHILEKTAQAIFQSWFVNFDGVTEWDDSELGKIPKGWNVVNLGEHSIIKGRIGWKGLTQSEYSDVGYHLVTGRQLVNENVDWDLCPRISEERYLESPEIMLKENDILMSKDGTIGRLAFINKLLHPTSVGTGIFVIRSDSDYINQFFLFAFFKSNSFKNIVKTRIEGSVIPHLYQRDINEFVLTLGPHSIIQKFSKLYEEIINLQYSNKSQISKLMKIRDVLFPKLISGEIRV